MTDGDSVTTNHLCNSENRDLRHPERLPPHHRTSDQEGSTGLFVQIVIYKFGSKIADVERPSERISGTGETIR